MNRKPWTDYADNRRGWKDGDPQIYGKPFVSTEAALAFMADSPLAFRIYQKDNGSVTLGELHEYCVAQRVNPRSPWTKVKTALASCYADAIDLLGEHKGNTRLILSRDFWQLEAAYHKRLVGVRA